MKSYMYIIVVMNGCNMWPKTEYTPPLPPVNTRMYGRPTIKSKKDAKKKNFKTQIKRVKVQQLLMEPKGF